METNERTTGHEDEPLNNETKSITCYEYSCTKRRVGSYLYPFLEITIVRSPLDSPTPGAIIKIQEGKAKIVETPRSLKLVRGFPRQDEQAKERKRQQTQSGTHANTRQPSISF